MNLSRSDNRIFLVCGHYGTGKTNVAVNLALKLKQSRERVTLIDIDTVNPYFRAADAAPLLESSGVRCILPVYANTNVDIPALPPDISSVFDENVTAVFDVGGDDTGSIVLSCYRDRIIESGYSMLCVCNLYRPMIASPEDAVGMIREIEGKSGLVCSSIVNNSNLGIETTPQIVAASRGYIEQISLLTGLPVAFTSVFDNVDYDGENILKMKNITKNIYGEI